MCLFLKLTLLPNLFKLPFFLEICYAINHDQMIELMTLCRNVYNSEQFIVRTFRTRAMRFAGPRILRVFLPAAVVRSYFSTQLDNLHK